MKKQAVFLLGIMLICFITLPASATLISGPAVIVAPGSVADDSPGAENTAQQGFNERQNVLLPLNLAIDGGTIAGGTLVSSHMIFFNTAGSSFSTSAGIWGFDGPILGVMSDGPGNLEAASNSLLGAIGTTYPGGFAARGMEGMDTYTLLDPYTLEVYMEVSEPGDWIRVVTAAKSVPEPSTMLLLGLGIVGVGFCTRRKFQN